MKQQEDHEREFGKILKSNGLVEPSEAYSNQLRDLIIETYGTKESEIQLSNPWVARGILGMAVLWSLSFLYFFRPFSVQPVFCISILSFIAGLWVLIVLMRRQVDFRISSNR